MVSHPVVLVFNFSKIKLIMIFWNVKRKSDGRALHKCFISNNSIQVQNKDNRQQ